MATSLIGLELEMGGVLLKFLQTGAETGGTLHAQEARYPAHSTAPTLHHHPRQDERFVIMEGALSFQLGTERRVVRAGEELAVPKGVPHSAHNPNDTPTLVLWETRPALRSAEFFWTMSRATRGRARPRLADAAAILAEYRDVFQLEKPSRFVQRIMFGCLAPLGRAALLQPLR
jgi:mannose-6-phosphate isomerase-like protein (cupin superfamily)